MTPARSRSSTIRWTAEMGLAVKRASSLGYVRPRPAISTKTSVRASGPNRLESRKRSFLGESSTKSDPVEWSYDPLEAVT